MSGHIAPKLATDGSSALERLAVADYWLPTVLFQEAVGGPPAVVLLVFLALLVATALSIYLAVRLYRGYRAGGGPGMLALGVGLVLLTTVPMVLRLVFSNVAGVDPIWQEVFATASQLLGLCLILGVIYGRR